MNHFEGKKIGVEKLTEGTYHTWKHKMRWLLTHDDLWNTVQQVPPTTPTPEWNKKNSRAMSIIGLSVEDRYQVDLLEVETAHEAWNCLAQLHERNTIGARLFLYRKLVTARYTPPGDMGMHLAGILETASRLTDIGQTVGEELLCSSLLGSLPPEYGPLITTIEGRSDDTISSKYVREKILEESVRLNGTDQEPHMYTQALATDRRSPMQRRASNPPMCFYCQKVGHIRRDCRLLRQHDMHGNLPDRKLPWTPRKREEQEETTHSKVVDMQMEENTRDYDTSRGYPSNDSETLSASMTELKVLHNYMNPLKNHNPLWIIDSGACMSMTKDLHTLMDYQELTTALTVTSAGGHNNPVRGKGSRKIYLKDHNGKTQSILLPEVFYVPALTDNLLAVSTLEDVGYDVIFQKGKVTLRADDNTLLLAHRENRLYVYREDTGKEALIAQACTHIWHARLGHRHYEGITQLNNRSGTPTLKLDVCNESNICTICITTKMKNKPFKTQPTFLTQKPFILIHADLCGPINPTSAGGNRYLLTAIDDHSRYLCTYALKHKNEASYHLQGYIEAGENLHGHRLQCLRTDGGGEFMGLDFKEYLHKKGITHQITVPYSPQSNGVAERFNHTLLDATRALLKQSGLSRNMWAEMAATATYLININATTHGNVTPSELWFGRKPKYEHLRLVGSKCFYFNNNPNRSKLDDRAHRGILVGYGPGHESYRIWIPELSKIIISRKVVFPDEKCSSEKCITMGSTSPSHVDHSLTGPPDDCAYAPEDGAPSPHRETQEREQPRRSDRSTKGTTAEKLTYPNLGEPSRSPQDWYEQHPLTQEKR